MRGANKGGPIQARSSRSRGSPNVSYASRRIAKLIKLGIFATSIISCWAGQEKNGQDKDKKCLEQVFMIHEDGADTPQTAQFEVRFGDHETFMEKYMNIPKKEWGYSLTLGKLSPGEKDGNQKKYLFRDTTVKSYTTSDYHFTLIVSNKEYITGSEQNKDSRYVFENGVGTGRENAGKIEFELDLRENLKTFNKALIAVGFECKDPPAPKKRQEMSDKDLENLRKTIEAKEKLEKLAWQHPTRPEENYQKDEEIWCTRGKRAEWVKIIEFNERRELVLELIGDGTMWTVPYETVTLTKKQDATKTALALQKLRLDHAQAQWLAQYRHDQA